MSRVTNLIVGAIVAVGAFHAYTKRVDTGDKEPGNKPAASVIAVTSGGSGGVALETEAAADRGASGAGAGSGASTGAKPEPKAAPPVKASAGAEEPTTAGGEGPASAAAAASGLRRDGIEALMAGDEAKGAFLLYRAARARTQSQDREDAVARLGALEKAAAEKAAKARTAGAGLDERAALSVAYLAALDVGRRNAHKARLDELVNEYIFTPRQVECADTHVVVKGDSLQKIAAKYNFPVEGIMKVNRLATTNLRLGDRLKVPRGPVEVLVVKSEFRLVVLLAGLYLREYSVGTGHDGCTPETSFTIEDKIKEPTWHSKEGVFPFGHPKNILGTRWMAFKNTEEHKGFGIHGTAFPNSIGTEASSGCIRMRNADVEELFGLVPKGAAVTITR